MWELSVATVISHINYRLGEMQNYNLKTIKIRATWAIGIHGTIPPLPE